MKPDPRKLKRAKLIERVRTVERSRLALAASEAEALRKRLSGVAERTRSLADHYAQQSGLVTGAELRRGKTMQGQLQQLSAMSRQHACEAEKRSDQSLDELAAAERRLKRAQEDRRDLVRSIVNHLGDR
ncbi:MAG: hypothetical protein ABGW87_13200 [Sphingomonadaceae bacterium]